MRFAIVAVACALFAGCSTTAWDEMRSNPREYFNLTPPTLVTDARVEGQQVVLNRGQALVVRLDEDPSSGQRWQMRELNSTAVIAPVRHDYTAKPGTDPPQPNVGEALFRLRGVAPGTQPIFLDYKHPSEAAAAKTIQFDVVVR